MVYNGTGISGFITYQKTYLKNNKTFPTKYLALAHSLTGPKTVLGHLVTRVESEHTWNEGV